MPLYDQIRKILSDHLDASIELQEAVITWYMTHPEEYARLERRFAESENQEEQR